jgi:hypothetical protein
VDKTVDNLWTRKAKKLSTSYTQDIHRVIHRLIHRVGVKKLLAIKKLFVVS